jgi:hypothetical protein
VATAKQLAGFAAGKLDALAGLKPAAGAIPILDMDAAVVRDDE